MQKHGMNRVAIERTKEVSAGLAWENITQWYTTDGCGSENKLLTRAQRCDIFVIRIRLSDSASTLNNKRTIQLMDCPTLSMSFVSSPFAMRGVSGIFGSAFVLVLFDEVERSNY